MAPKLWGVDSAQLVTKELYDCVLKNYGKPNYWGRYLTTVPNASDGLTKEEIQFLHNSGTRVMPIYNNFRAAVGYDQGKIAAVNAVFHARRLGFPKGKLIFANVERFFDVDGAWIRGWVDGMFPTGYRPGIYHDPVKGGFSAAYCQAVGEDANVADQTVLWSAEPETGISKARRAPRFNPAGPPCKGNVWAWQYGRNAPNCPIDTNLIDRRVFEATW